MRQHPSLVVSFVVIWGYWRERVAKAIIHHVKLSVTVEVGCMAIERATLAFAQGDKVGGFCDDEAMRCTVRCAKTRHETPVHVLKS